MDKQRGWKGKLYPVRECELIKVEGMMELENHGLATILVITALGKNHQEMWKPVDKSLYLHSLKVSLH